MPFLIAARLAVVCTVLQNSVGIVAVTTGSTPHSSTLARSVRATQTEVPATNRFMVKENSSAEQRALAAFSNSPSMKWLEIILSEIVGNLKRWCWLWKKLSPEEVFKRLKLNTDVNKILTDRKVRHRAVYISMFNEKNPDKKVTMIEILSKTYGDVALARMIEEAHNVKGKWRAAKMLANMQRNYWKADGRTAEYVFKLLQLDKVGDSLFESPQLSTWYKYVTIVKKEDANADMISVLLTHYANATLFKMFYGARFHVPSTRVVTAKLERFGVEIVTFPKIARP